MFLDWQNHQRKQGYETCCWARLEQIETQQAEVPARSPWTRFGRSRRAVSAKPFLQRQVLHSLRISMQVAGIGQNVGWAIQGLMSTLAPISALLFEQKIPLVFRRLRKTGAFCRKTIESAR